MASIRSQGVTVWTDASEGARCVVAAESALVAEFQALVHVLADLVHSRSEPVVAGALETTVDVSAGSIAAYVLLGQAFVIVHAASSARVQHVSRGTLASEGAIGVYALAACTRVRHEQTLVQIDACVVSSRSLGTQSSELLWTKKHQIETQFRVYFYNNREITRYYSKRNGYRYLPEDTARNISPMLSP